MGKTFEPRDGDGALFLNDKKTTPNHPDWRGNILIDGREYWVSAWKKTSKAGAPYMSLSAKAKDDAPPRTPSRDEEPPPEDPGERIPW